MFPVKYSIDTMEEYLDILDEEGKKTGVTRSYSDAHREGLIHRSVHVWFFNPEKGLLLQKRSSTRAAYPNHWDISASGHISAGQTSLEAAKRETEEELGVTPPDDAFCFLFTLEEHIILNAGTYISNEFQDIYLVRTGIDPALHYKTNEEVSEIRWIDLNSFIAWTRGQGELLVPHDEEYARLIALLDNV